MSFRMVAFHYPKTEHREELLQRIKRAAEDIKAAPGFIDVEVLTEQTSGALVSTAKFDSREACLKALETAARSTDIRFSTHLEERAREIYNLIEPK